jgi:hypothetical protein
MTKSESCFSLRATTGRTHTDNLRLMYSAAEWCILVYNAAMASDSAVRQSVSMPSSIARRVRALAKRERTSASRVIVDLIESGLDTREREKQEFFELADRLAQSSDSAEQKRLKKELERMTYGD